MSKIQNPPGMHDILPNDSALFQHVFDAVSDIAESYGFGRIETPVVEFEELFTRGLGMTTDIVQKEMYTLRTRGGDKLALRPEGTAPAVRSYVQHGMKTWPQPVKLWYFSPMFRHERQQAGRFREFWQFGFEILGETDVSADAEIIQVYSIILKNLGLSKATVQINSIGCNLCRPYYKKVLSGYLRTRVNDLCPRCKERMRVNPLRVLDCKEERCSRVKVDAPEILDHLCDACRQHFRGVLEFLDEIGIPYLLQPHLVRGLDYYSRTVFEFWPESEAMANENGGQAPKAQIALASGGRYDLLMKQLGAKDAGGIGGGGGVERVVQALKEQKRALPKARMPKVFVAQLGDKAKKQAMVLFEELRKAGILARASLGRDSIKSQLRVAEKFGVPYILILGQKEALENSVILRTAENGMQETVPRTKLIEVLRERLKNRT